MLADRELELQAKAVEQRQLPFELGRNLVVPARMTSMHSARLRKAYIAMAGNGMPSDLLMRKLLAHVTAPKD